MSSLATDLGLCGIFFFFFLTTTTTPLRNKISGVISRLSLGTCVLNVKSYVLLYSPTVHIMILNLYSKAIDRHTHIVASDTPYNERN